MSLARGLTVFAATVAILVVAGAVSARAEFFGCNDHSGRVVYESRWHDGGSHYVRDARDHWAHPRHISRARVTYLTARRYYETHYR